MEKIIEKILESDLSLEDKKTLIMRVAYASHGIKRTIVPGLYLHTEFEGREINMELWSRLEDTYCYHGPTGYDVDKIFELMKKYALSDSCSKKL